MSSLSELIKRHALKAMQSTKPTVLLEAEVIAAPPDLQIKIKGNDKLIIPKELIVVSEHLTRHKRIVTIKHVEGAEREVGDIKPPPKDHDSEGSLAFAYSYVEMQFEDVLKVGDKVMVETFEGGQKFYIKDRIVTYGEG